LFGFNYCPLLAITRDGRDFVSAQSGHADRAESCPLFGVKRTSIGLCTDKGAFCIKAGNLSAQSTDKNHSLRFLLQAPVFLWRHLWKALNESHKIPNLIVIVNLAV
jgi:hypothetical protein